jgi:hypothetical protein
MTMGLTFRRTARRINRLKEDCVFIPPGYLPLLHRPPDFLLLSHLIQDRLVDLLKPAAKAAGHVSMEFAFRALPDHELRAADVAFVRRERLDHTDLDDNLQGAPDLVIEILAPSNTVAEMYDREKLCLENGSLEFWVVDADRHQVKVSTPDGHTITYRSGQEIPLRLFGDASLAVDSIFG